jgi:carbon-monoxide dehydrogenase medium subunit
VGADPSPAAFTAAAEAAQKAMGPVDDVHASARFKRHLARVLTVRALVRATARARGEEEDR